MTVIVQRLAMLLLVTFSLCLAPRPAQARVTKVLMVTGDWKSQAWYQDVVMGGKTLYRGRFIADKVSAAAPGQFEFTDVTNYVGQEYIDANYLSQFDVLLIADTQGWSLSPEWFGAVQNFVKNGGGLIYCASYKWGTFTPRGTGFDAALPTTFEPTDDVTSDWQGVDFQTPDKNFMPAVILPNHPLLKGLDWAHTPTLDAAFQVKPKAGADVLLRTPSGAPILTAWDYGKGRAVTSASIFANDEVSTKFGQNWPDFGRYYAQVFAWLGAHSINTKAVLTDKAAQFSVTVDYGKTRGKIPPGVFSFNSAIDPPNLGRLSGIALDNFQALHPRGGFSRINPQGFEPERGKFNFAALDDKLAEFKRLGLEPEVVFDDLFSIPWIWDKGTSYENPTPKEVADCADYVAAFLKHAQAVKYLEVGNEPALNGPKMDGYVRLFQAVARRVHRDFPGVRVGALGGYEIPYVFRFIDRAGADVDFIARHPYGHSGAGVFRLQDQERAYARSKGFNQIQFFITEWDYWIQGRPKFDYMMKRTFESVERDDLIGALHYRLDQYAEPVYLFGALWADWGPGKGKAGTPMHDAYDAYWAFRDFRGSRAAVTKTVGAGTTPDIAPHILADASRDGDTLNAVLYYDWAYDGTGFKDYAHGVNYPHAAVQVTLTFPPAARARTLTVSRATGEGFTTDKSSVQIPAGATHLTQTVEITPLTAVSLSIQ